MAAPIQPTPREEMARVVADLVEHLAKPVAIDTDWFIDRTADLRAAVEREFQAQKDLRLEQSADPEPLVGTPEWKAQQRLQGEEID